MALSNPRIIYGVHEFTPYSRTDGTFYGTLRVLESSSLNLKGALNKQTGGSQRYPWDIADGLITAELALQIKEYPDFVFQLFLGKKPTDVNASSTGTVSTLTNKLNATVKQATTGIASITAKSGSEADLKFGKYVVVAASSTTVNIYCSTDVDFQRNTPEVYVDDTLKITNSALTVTSGSTTDVTGFGLTINGGSGTIGMTTGDTAIFEVLPKHSGAMQVNVGSTTDVFPEFGAVMIAEQKASGEMFDVEAYRCKAIGLPVGLKAKAYSDAQVTAECFYDSVQDAVLRFRHVKPT